MAEGLLLQYTDSDEDLTEEKDFTFEELDPLRKSTRDHGGQEVHSDWVPVHHGRQWKDRGYCSSRNG